jgi:hypothetical protein
VTPDWVFFMGIGWCHHLDAIWDCGKMYAIAGMGRKGKDNRPVSIKSSGSIIIFASYDRNRRTLSPPLTRQWAERWRRPKASALGAGGRCGDRRGEAGHQG